MLGREQWCEPLFRGWQLKHAHSECRGPGESLTLASCRRILRSTEALYGLGFPAAFEPPAGLMPIRVSNNCHTDMPSKLPAAFHAQVTYDVDGS